MGRLENAIELYGEVATIKSKSKHSWNGGQYTQRIKKIIKKGVPVKTIQQLSQFDPSGNNKYLDWILNRRLNTKAQLKTLKDFVTCFHTSPNKFKYHDIYQYKTESDVVDEMNTVINKLSKSEIKTYGADLIADTKQYKIIRPKTHMAAKMYGSGTKWCLTSSDTQTFNMYIKNYVIYFCIVKDVSIINNLDDFDERERKMLYNRYHKLAIIIDKINNNRFLIYNAQDNEIPGHLLKTTYNIDFSELCWNHYYQHIGQIRMVPRVAELKKDFINRFQDKKIPTYNDNIAMLDKIISNLEES